MRQMNPMTVTHVVTSDVNENTEKVNRARMYQCVWRPSLQILYEHLALC